MCLLAILHRVCSDAALVIGANREEFYARGGDPPRRLEGLDAVAGVDPSHGGTWMGVNGHGVVAAVLPHFVSMSWGGAPDRLDPDFFLSEVLNSKRDVKGGLNYREAHMVMEMVADSHRLVGLDPLVALARLHAVLPQLKEHFFTPFTFAPETGPAMRPRML